MQAIAEVDGQHVEGSRLIVTRAQNSKRSTGPGFRYAQQPLFDGPADAAYGGFHGAPQQPRAPRAGAVNVYVKNLDLTVDEDLLVREFSQFGQILSAKVRPLKPSPPLTRCRLCVTRPACRAALAF